MTSPRTTQGAGGRPPFRRGGRRRRQCFCKETTVDYKDVSSIRRFITDRGRIEAGKKQGNCAKCQRTLTTAIKRARHLALLPYAPEHLRVTGAVASNSRISDDEDDEIVDEEELDSIDDSDDDEYDDDEDNDDDSESDETESAAENVSTGAASEAEDSADEDEEDK